MTRSSSTGESDAEQDDSPKDDSPETDETATAPEDETGDTDESGGEGDGSDDADAPAAAATDAVDEDAGEEPAGFPPRPVDPEETSAGRKGTGWIVAAGAVAVVSLGLGIVSLSGAWLGDLMADRQRTIGQLELSQMSEMSDQVDAIYGSPSHTTALFNGFFAVAAMITAGVALLFPVLTGNPGKSPNWVRGVAYGGLALGVIGLVIAAVMWFDVFTPTPDPPPPPTPQPQVPAPPAP